VRNEAQKASRRKYESSEKGKLAKKRQEATYVASGGRAATELRRATKPISEARKEARRKWARNNKDYFRADRAFRRSLERNLSEIDKFVMFECIDLAKMREKCTGIKWEVDHIIPISLGGTSTFLNLQVVPSYWNKSKSNKHSERFLTQPSIRSAHEHAN
jgi:5-methylcytosine-specific restriction endonuclease McrA